mmetsp:Transcript_7944/g.23949  ORF Transcript_7944/g.23949 Transcript_7944/m.23949 type:complete len:253 (-) Transcript_7944:56-814(-)
MGTMLRLSRAASGEGPSGGGGGPMSAPNRSHDHLTTASAGASSGAAAVGTGAAGAGAGSLASRRATVVKQELQRAGVGGGGARMGAFGIAGFGSGSVTEAFTSGGDGSGGAFGGGGGGGAFSGDDDDGGGVAPMRASEWGGGGGAARGGGGVSLGAGLPRESGAGGDVDEGDDERATLPELTLRGRLDVGALLQQAKAEEAMDAESAPDPDFGFGFRSLMAASSDPGTAHDAPAACGFMAFSPGGDDGDGDK